MKMKVIDATNLIVGRMASYVAKGALNGESYRIINVEKAVITGVHNNIISRFRQKRDVGSRYQGPFYPTRADRIVKRVIRGMLPYKLQRGREALSSIRTYIGVPDEFAKAKPETIEGAKLGFVEKRMYMTVGEISKLIGATNL